MNRDSSVVKKMKRDALWPKPKFGLQMLAQQGTKTTRVSTDSNGMNEQMSIQKPRYMFTNHTS